MKEKIDLLKEKIKNNLPIFIGGCAIITLLIVILVVLALSKSDNDTSSETTKPNATTINEVTTTASETTKETTTEEATTTEVLPELETREDGLCTKITMPDGTIYDLTDAENGIEDGHAYFIKDGKKYVIETDGHVTVSDYVEKTTEEITTVNNNNSNNNNNNSDNNGNNSNNNSNSNSTSNEPFVPSHGYQWDLINPPTANDTYFDINLWQTYSKTNYPTRALQWLDWSGSPEWILDVPSESVFMNQWQDFKPFDLYNITEKQIYYTDVNTELLNIKPNWDVTIAYRELTPHMVGFFTWNCDDGSYEVSDISESLKQMLLGRGYTYDDIAMIDIDLGFHYLSNGQAARIFWRGWYLKDNTSTSTIIPGRAFSAVRDEPLLP